MDDSSNRPLISSWKEEKRKKLEGEKKGVLGQASWRVDASNWNEKRHAMVGREWRGKRKRKEGKKGHDFHDSRFATRTAFQETWTRVASRVNREMLPV